MTSENKTKILKDLIESKDFTSYQQAGDFINLIEDGDDVDFLLKFIHEAVPSLKQCTVLMFGKFGFPEMGVAGAALGTVIARIIEFSVMFLFAIKNKVVFINNLFQILFNFFYIIIFNC